MLAHRTVETPAPSDDPFFGPAALYRSRTHLRLTAKIAAAADAGFEPSQDASASGAPPGTAASSRDSSVSCAASAAATLAALTGP